MGWFFNKASSANNQSNQSGQNFNSKSNFQTKSSYYSKKRHCENDPEDNQFIICKTVIKDNNGTREEQERIPKDSYRNGITSQDSSQSFSFNVKSSFGNGREEQEKAFDKFNSFFIQPSFFDFHNDSQLRPSHDHESQTYISSYSKSKSCHSDPEDPEYLICKSKVYDGTETKQVEERIKVSDQFMIPSFRGQFDKFGHEIDKQIHQLMGDINRGFNFIAPLVGPFMGFINQLQKLDQQGLPINGNQNKFPMPGESNQRQDYFNSNNRNKKDTNVYDL